jgi:ankyrin repeat protein
MVKLLLQSGAEIDAYNPEGQTALHAAVIAQKVECADLLLQWGASLEDVACNGRTPFTTAITHNSHAVLKLFIESRYEHVTSAHIEGTQAMAVIARHADAETMSIVASSLQLKLSLGTSGNALATSRGTLRQRGDYDEELAYAFEELLSSITMSKESSFCEELPGRWRH